MRKNLHDRILRAESKEHIYIYIYIQRERERERERGSSYTYTWCNSTRVTTFLSHRSMRDLTDKNKTPLFFITLNTYLINSLLTISLLIKYFLCLFFSLLLSLSFHFLCNFSYVSTFQNKEKKKNHSH